MKHIFKKSFLATVAVSAATFLLPLGASAQTSASSPTGSDRTANASPTVTTVDVPHERSHYGWIGLLGLLGLAGLLPKRRDVLVQERTDVRR